MHDDASCPRKYYGLHRLPFPSSQPFLSTPTRRLSLFFGWFLKFLAEKTVNARSVTVIFRVPLYVDKRLPQKNSSPRIGSSAKLSHLADLATQIKSTRPGPYLYVIEFGYGACSLMRYRWHFVESTIPKTSQRHKVIRVLICYINNIDFEFGSIQRPLCIIMAPAGNTDARYSTSNKSQRDMYVVNINLNIQGRPGKSNLHGDFHVLMGQVIEIGRASCRERVWYWV